MTRSCLHRASARFMSDYAVTFRRTVGVRMTGDGAAVRAIRVFTRSQPTRTALRVELHAGKRAAAKAIAVSGYNAVVSRVTVGTGTRANGSGVRLGTGRKASFGLEVEHMIPVRTDAAPSDCVLLRRQARPAEVLDRAVRRCRADAVAAAATACGGICPQPALLAGLLPHLDRDEIEVYLWMFFNAWAACYRSEVQAFVEHPQPVLGFGNCAPFKTSDQSNAMKWLAYLFVYEREGLLHLGRAIPRAWFAQEQAFSATRLSTPAGIVSVEYRPQLAAGKIEADVELELRAAPAQLLLRFRHPEKKPIQSVTINGRASRAFDARSGDVELPTVGGKVRVVVNYGEGGSFPVS